MALIPSLRAIPDRTSISVDWLVRLRWAEIVGQAATVLAAQVLFGIALPIVPLLTVIGIGVLSNVILEVRLGRGAPPSSVRGQPVPTSGFGDGRLTAVMALDVLLLTALLFFTGGPTNPFGMLYLVQIALAAVMVHTPWVWLLVVLSFSCYGVLLVAHEPLAMPDSTHRLGTWVALGVASAFVVHFLLRITGALAARDAELAAARHLAARQERLASLATMAAGAAHELSTPLGTVALAAKELERALTRRLPAAAESAEAAAPGAAPAATDPLIEDARLIREQVGRCRAILDQMAQGAGTIGESLTKLTVRELIEESCVRTRAQPEISRLLPDDLAELTLEVPRVAVTSALRSLFTNAQDASSAERPVVVEVRRTERAIGGSSALQLTITDRGSGMEPEVLARIGEPFYTTKAPGRGMGLGMFLARAVVEGVGGALQIDSVRGRGTIVQVTLPQRPAQNSSPSSIGPTGPAGGPTGRGSSHD